MYIEISMKEKKIKIIYITAFTIVGKSPGCGALSHFSAFSLISNYNQRSNRRVFLKKKSF